VEPAADNSWTLWFGYFGLSGTGMSPGMWHVWPDFMIYSKEK
jgi:hypothetical protein